MVDNKRREGSDQIKQVDDRGITSDRPGGANKATSKKASRRRLKRAREEKSLLSKDIRARKDKSKFKHKSKKDRKAKKKKFSELAAHIDNHPEDVNMVDVNTPGEDMKGSANSNDHMFAVKETRIIPVKVGRFWRYPTVNSVESKRDESSTESNEPPIESNKSPVQSNESSIVDSKSPIEINKIPVESIESNALSRFSTMVLRKEQQVRVRTLALKRAHPARDMDSDTEEIVTLTPTRRTKAEDENSETEPTISELEDGIICRDNIIQISLWLPYDRDPSRTHLDPSLSRPMTIDVIA